MDFLPEGVACLTARFRSGWPRNGKIGRAEQGSKVPGRGKESRGLLDAARSGRLRVEGEKSSIRRSIALGEVLKANGQPARHANRQKGREANIWCPDTTISNACRCNIRSQSSWRKASGQQGSQAYVQACDHPSRQTGIRLPIKAAEQAGLETVKRSAMQTGKRASSQVVGRISCQMAKPSLRRSKALCKFLNEDDYLGIRVTTIGATCLTSAQPYV